MSVPANLYPCPTEFLELLHTSIRRSSPHVYLTTCSINVMAEGTVTERRLRPIQDAIASNNWKPALKECEKWQKKGEKSDKFLVTAIRTHRLTTL
jgi:hypothetical protein